MAAKVQYLSDNRLVYREFIYFDKSEREWRLNFRGLHRTVLARLQENLIHEIGEIKRSEFTITEDSLARLEPILGRYTQAVRDLEYMDKSAENAKGNISRDLFVVRSSNQLGRVLLEQEGLMETEEGMPVARDPGQGEFFLPGRQSRYTIAEKAAALSLKLKWEKIQLFAALIITAIFVLLPMLVMVLHRDKSTALIVSSAFTVGFTLMVAVLDIKADIAIGAVAAYTAVLGTFVVSTLHSM